MTEDDLAGLNQLLEEWSIKDALTVLSEIDKRILVIDAIEKHSSDKSADELHFLHPLIVDARWLFGPEYESSEYISNSQLQTIAKRIFGKRAEQATFSNNKRRPDLLFFA